MNLGQGIAKIFGVKKLGNAFQILNFTQIQSPPKIFRGNFY